MKYTCYGLLLALMLYVSPSLAQDIAAKEWFGNARSLAMGDAWLASENVFDTMHYVLPEKQDIALARAAVDVRWHYAHADMGMRNFLGEAMLPWMNVCLSLGQSGQRDWMESLASLSLSRQTGGWRYGIRMGMYHLAGEEISSKQAWLSSCYFYYRPNEQWAVGGAMFNLSASRVYQMDLRQSAHLACMYRPEKMLQFILELEKQQKQVLKAHAGMEAALWKDRLLLRIGAEYPYIRPSVGLALHIKRFCLEAACRLQEENAWTYGMSLAYSL